ncbi:MAG: protein-glutamate O-methyltransferase [Pseudomonadales bacterium]|nr:protein-glutamate O-methyltransferase [Pseudomonadales bacterium]
MSNAAQPVQMNDREFPMSDHNFSTIAKIAYQYTGIKLPEQKRQMIYSRIARRIRALNLANFDQYCEIISDNKHAEFNEFINSITTNLTSFFRENHHFEYLESTIIPHLKKIHERDRRVRVWSAGCSTGEEPYSIAMTLLKNFSGSSNWDLKILATDLDSNVVATGRNGIYAADRVSGLESALVKKWFAANADSSRYVVADEAKKLIQFNRLNLLDSWPMKHKFDIIFCRNVVIYFDKPTQKKLFDRYAEQLNDGGYLIIGHSESLHKLTDRFESIGKTIYRKLK